MADFNKAIVAEAYQSRGLTHQARKEWEAALADYDQAILIDTRHRL